MGNIFKVRDPPFRSLEFNKLLRKQPLVTSWIQQQGVPSTVHQVIDGFFTQTPEEATWLASHRNLFERRLTWVGQEVVYTLSLDDGERVWKRFVMEQDSSS